METETKTSPVLRDWVLSLPWKMQSALLSALRGVDGGPAPRLKQAQKFLRAAVQHDADPSTSYMAYDLSWLRNDVAKREAQNELGRTSFHYVHHLIEGLTIISYWSDEEFHREVANDLVELLLIDHTHWLPETKNEMLRRLSS